MTNQKVENSNSIRSDTVSDSDADSSITVDLTDGEVTNLAFGMPPTTTVDWFEFDEEIEDEFNDRLESVIRPRLQATMDEILTCNPWLTGRYVSKRQFEYSATRRWFDVQDMLVVVPSTSTTTMPPLDPALTSYQELFQLGQRSDLGLTLVHENYAKQPFWKVGLVPSTNRKSFAMYVSLSHGIGDGYCFYALYNMLVGASPVVSMNPERISSTKQQQEEAM